MARFPYTKAKSGSPLRKLWTVQLYNYLANFFTTVHMDPTINSPYVNGVPEIRKTASGRNWGIPFASGAGGGTWSGLVWYLGVLKWDFSRVGAVLNGPLNDPPGITVNGMFLKIKLADGSYEWTDVFATPADTDEYSYYWVASGDSENGYYLNSNTCGDIRIEMVPWLPEEEAEEE